MVIAYHTVTQILNLGFVGRALNKKNKFFCSLRNYVLNCMSAFPDISVIAIGAVFIVNIFALLSGGLKDNPKSEN